MIAGGVGFILNMLNLVQFLLQVKIIHFLILIGGAVILKWVYGYIQPQVKDPLTTHPLARKFFYSGMGVLALSLAMRAYAIPYYSWLLYAVILLQVVALGISFSPQATNKQELNEEILDNKET